MKYSSKNVLKVTRYINFQCIFDMAFIFKNPVRHLVTNKLARELSTRAGKTRSSEARE